MLAVGIGVNVDVDDVSGIGVDVVIRFQFQVLLSTCIGARSTSSVSSLFSLGPV